MGLPKGVAVAALTVFGGIGITLLEIIDLRVYQQLLRAYFEEGRKLENEFYWLPPVRTRILESTNGRGVTPLVTRFYVAANAVVLLLGGFSVSIWSYRQGGVGLMSLTTILTLLFIGSWCLFLYGRSGMRKKISALLSTPSERAAKQ